MIEFRHRSTAHDSEETTHRCESNSREDHPRHTQMEDVVGTDILANVATVVAEAIDDPAEENDRESLWNVDGDPESADDAEEEIPFRHPRVRTCQLGFKCDAFEQLV